MKIVWTNSATSDLQSIRDYIAQGSDYYADHLVAGIIKAVGILERFPELGPVVPEFGEDEIRERILDNYRVLYQTRVDRVLVLAVVHASRDLGSVDLQP